MFEDFRIKIAHQPNVLNSIFLDVIQSCDTQLFCDDISVISNQLLNNKYTWADWRYGIVLASGASDPGSMPSPNNQR